MQTIVWIKAMRLRTLPLAISSVLLGSFLALYFGVFEIKIALLSGSTAILLQILSNLANDLGDGLKGTDNNDRIGPTRAIQSGAISKKQMVVAIAITILLSLFSGVWLLLEGIKVQRPGMLIIFLFIGLGAIYSAIKYTIGSKPYGYAGLGDLFVFFWFGIVGVSGTFYLHGQLINPDVLLPSASMGLLAVGVLNLNNLRDRISDSKAGKRTIVVRIGQHAGKIYQSMLVGSALVFTSIFVFRNYSQFSQLLFLLPIPVLLFDVKRVLEITDPRKFDPFLKRFSIQTFFFSLTLGTGFLIAHYATGQL
jgi:1,4-dihydroxy-2-naphthoate octaprenyltransferase